MRKDRRQEAMPLQEETGNENLRQRDESVACSLLVADTVYL
jgi:hypothetical protein